jgi:hypothetical protein
MADATPITSNPAHETLPPAVREAIAITNATVIGEQPAILANLALADQIFNQHMLHQERLARQQAVNFIRLAVVARSVNLLLTNGPASQEADGQIERALRLLDRLNESPAAPAQTV